MPACRRLRHRLCWATLAAEALRSALWTAPRRPQIPHPWDTTPTTRIQELHSCRGNANPCLLPAGWPPTLVRPLRTMQSSSHHTVLTDLPTQVCVYNVHSIRAGQNHSIDALLMSVVPGPGSRPLACMADGQAAAVHRDSMRLACLPTCMPHTASHTCTGRVHDQSTTRGTPGTRMEESLT